MAKQSIGLGTAADDGTGDNLRAAFDKVNDNFLEIYTLIGDASSLTSGISATATVVTLTAPLIVTSIHHHLVVLPLVQILWNGLICS